MRFRNCGRIYCSLMPLRILQWQLEVPVDSVGREYSTRDLGVIGRVMRNFFTLSHNVIPRTIVDLSKLSNSFVPKTNFRRQPSASSSTLNKRSRLLPSTASIMAEITHATIKGMTKSSFSLPLHYLPRHVPLRLQYVFFCFLFEKRLLSGMA